MNSWWEPELFLSVGTESVRSDVNREAATAATGFSVKRSLSSLPMNRSQPRAVASRVPRIAMILDSL